MGSMTIMLATDWSCKRQIFRHFVDAFRGR